MTSDVASKDKSTKRINFRKNFYLLLIGRFVSALGSSMFNFAVSLYVLDITKSAAAFSTILALGFIPGVFVNILGGVYVDKSNKKRLVVISDLLSAEAVFIFTYIVHYDPGNILVFVAYVLVLNTFQSLFGLSLTASIPNIVSEENVARTNATMQGMNSFVNIVGPLLGALVYAAAGLEVVFALNALSFLVSGIVNLFIRFKEGAGTRLIEEGKTFMDNFKDTFKYLKKQEIIRFFMIFGVIVNTIYNPLIMMVVRYINFEVLKGTEVQISIIQAIESLGIILGAFYITIQRSNTKFLRKFFRLLLLQSALVIMWIFPALPVFRNAPYGIIMAIFSSILFVIALLNTIQNIPLFTHFQLQIPDDMRGRVFGVLNTALIASTPIGIWIFGLLLDHVYWAFVPLFAGALMVITCLIGRRSKAFKEFINDFYY